MGNKVGNVAQTLGYRAPGTASDWMLAELNVIAITPELGTERKWSEGFYLNSKAAIEDVVTQNYPWMKFSFEEIIKKH